MSEHLALLGLCAVPALKVLLWRVWDLDKLPWLMDTARDGFFEMHPVFRGHVHCCLPTLKKKKEWSFVGLEVYWCLKVVLLLLPSKFGLLDNRIFRKVISDCNEKDCYSSKETSGSLPKAPSIFRCSSVPEKKEHLIWSLQQSFVR